MGASAARTAGDNVMIVPKVSAITFQTVLYSIAGPFIQARHLPENCGLSRWKTAFFYHALHGLPIS